MARQLLTVIKGKAVGLQLATSVGSNALRNIAKYAIKTGNITQVTLLTNVMRYLSNIVTVMSLILRNIITTSNEVTNLVSNPLSNA